VEVLGLLAAGLGNKVIAGRLAISEHTVKSHVTSLFAKLGVSTRAEAVAAGVRQGLLML
jgi:ATP/maltotriose-dependent transcriptional regulator MalT